jgi:hypothetical protein
LGERFESSDGDCCWLAIDRVQACSEAVKLCGLLPWGAVKLWASRNVLYISHPAGNYFGKNHHQEFEFLRSRIDVVWCISFVVSIDP